MKVYSGANIRNVAMVGHGHAGKTTLVSAMLYTAGATPRLGRVDDGSATTDYDEEEIARKMSICDRPRRRRVGHDQDQYPRYSRIQHVRPRGQDGAAGRRCGDRRRRWRRRSRSRDPARLELLRGIQDAAPDRRQPHGPRSRQCRARARIADRSLRPRRDSYRTAHRQREKFDGRGRPRPHEGLHLRAGRKRQRQRDRNSRQHEGRKRRKPTRSSSNWLPKATTS